MKRPECAVLGEDPELTDDLPPERRTVAMARCVAPLIRVARGSWSPRASAARMRFGIGLLVLDGLLMRRVGVEGRFGAELLGRGDLLRPWQHEDAAATLAHSRGWVVLSPARMAVLDREFIVRLAPYPEVTAALFGRAVRRARQLALNMAIVHQPRIDVRLHMFLWELADRWGTVGPEGVRVQVRLTHSVIADLVAATRPTVTKALGELAQRGAARWQGDAWLLCGAPPAELGEVRAFSEATSPLSVASG